MLDRTGFVHIFIFGFLANVFAFQISNSRFTDFQTPAATAIATMAKLADPNFNYLDPSPYASGD